MGRISINQTRWSLFLISLTFLAMWIEFFICNFFTMNMPNSNFMNLVLLYLFSLFLPAVGLLVFMRNIRIVSSRWYWGIPFLIGLILNTFVRDLTFMTPFRPGDIFQFVYGQPFIASFFPIFHNSTVMMPIVNLISIFFSLSAALFCLSVPEEKRKKFMLPFALSIISSFANIILFIIVSMQKTIINSSFSTYTSLTEITFVIFSIAIFILGLSFIRVAVIYDK
jgi:hypothetical protein